MLRQFELIERVRSYDPTADEALLNRAYVYAMRQHGSQKRASGDPYFAHPIEVAGILTDYRLDTETIVTALLHDVIEDTDATREKVAELFGGEIADDVVDAEELREALIASLQRVDERSEAEEEAETLALLADPTHMQMSELELVRALQSDRDGGQEERY